MSDEVRSVSQKVNKSEDKKTIYIWDLDETIIIYQSLLDSTYAARFNKNAKVAQYLGLQMEILIFKIADEHFFFKEVEDHNVIHVSGSFSEDITNQVEANCADSRLKSCYVEAGRAFDNYRDNTKALLGKGDRTAWRKLMMCLDILTESWGSLAMKPLSSIEKRSNSINVLVTTTQLIPTLAKLVLYGFGKYFPIDNIYSAANVGKKQCFELIMDVYGENSEYVVVGDGQEEEQASEELHLTFWKVQCHDDLVNIHRLIICDRKETHEG